MSDCCIPKGLAVPKPGSDRCPGCGAKGSSVDPITLKALLTGDGLRRGVPPAPRFCATLGCPVVYYDNAVPVRFEQDLVTVPVHAKHPDEEDVPACYCFGHTPGSVRAEVEATGRSTAGRAITAEVKAGHCACEVKNPKGTCCLGDVSRVERSALSSVAAGAALPTAGRHDEKEV